MTRTRSGALAFGALVTLSSLPAIAPAGGCALPQVRVITPITDKPWLPDSGLPAGTTAEQSITLHGARGQRLLASFLLRASRAERLVVSGEIHLSDERRILVDVRYVKPWYQGETAWQWINHKPGRTLVPELLLRDDRLVQVDTANSDNRIRVIRDGRSQYLTASQVEQIGVPGDSRRMPVEARHYTIEDAPTTQPLDLPAHVTRQVWLDFSIPADLAAGVYSGSIAITCAQGIGVTIPIDVRIHAFRLQPSAMRYGVYYRGVLNFGKPLITSEKKTLAQMKIELQALYDAGVRYPTLYQPLDDTVALARVLDLRNEIGFPTDEVYYLGSGIAEKFKENDMRAIRGIVDRAGKIFASKGYRNIVFYGVDEGDAEVIRTQLPGWAEVRRLGHAVMVAGRKYNLALYPAAADLYIAAYAPDPGLAGRIHSHGNRIYSYADPQGGVENPFLYRRNYGLALWQAKYDGALIYAYQDMRGVAWSDFDGGYRDHFLVYPTSDGYIPTLAWEGLREAIYDLRYLETLETAVAGSTPSAACEAERRAYRAARTVLRAAELGAYPTLDEMRTAVAMGTHDLMAARRQCGAQPFVK